MTGEKPTADARPSLRWDGPGQITAGQDVTVTLQADNASAIASVKSVVRYDPAVLQFLGGEPGSAVPNEQRAAAEPRLDVGGGRIRIEFSGAPMAAAGEVAVLRFKALMPRPATMVTVQQFAANGADGAAVGVMAPRALVMVVTP